jgi:glycosyltransferase involved in cell wall biosynthesis
VNGAGSVRRRDVLAGPYWMQQFERTIGALRPLFDRYDVVQAYATYPILPLLVESSRPYVAFEHGTMREIPFEDSFLGRLLRLAYRRADKVVITNADVLSAARKLGLTNYAFVPHPVDEAKYCPGESGFRAELGAEANDLVCFSPSRHDWDIKGNDRMLRAFAEFVRAGPSSALLALNEWGADVGRSRALARSLGVEEQIRWLAPLPKRKLIDAYRGADVVLDQFEIGTFGAVGPEAMACGAPVVMAFDAALHEWCFPEPPPVRAARTPTEILHALSALASDPAERIAIGARGRAWVVRHHSSRTLVERQLAVYDEVLKDGRGDSAAARPRARWRAGAKPGDAPGESSPDAPASLV